MACWLTFASTLGDRWQVVGGSIDHADAAAGAIAPPHHRLFPQVHPLLWRPQGRPPGLTSHLQDSASYQMAQQFPVAASAYDDSPPHMHVLLWHPAYPPCVATHLQLPVCHMDDTSSHVHRASICWKDRMLLVWPEGQAPSRSAAQQAAQQWPV